ncbi:MAG: PIN domain nuclease [Nitrospirae bacterium]|nr:PIN domain nuclease [Nitrospirota bacterium]NTW66965.1 PIN domain nuclease [Nitrospirota bacterium]
MVLVDTSIWIDFLQHTVSSSADRLAGLIRENNRAVLCGIVIQEVLQGIRERGSHAATKGLLIKFPYLDRNREVYIAAASLYRHLRGKGITIPSTDAAIAALALHHRIPLFTRDEHFSVIARHSKLELYS